MTTFCTRCGGEFSDGDAFCTSCGAARSEAADSSDETVGVELPPEAVPAALPAPPVEPALDEPPTAQVVVAASEPVERRRGAPAPIQRRVMSWAIDAAIVAVGFTVASGLHELLGVVVLVAGTAAYYVLMIEGQWHGTVGHRVVGLAVLDEESREPIGRRSAGLRLAINAVLAIPFGLGLFLNVPMLDRSSGRTVHDVGSGTVVVSTR